MTASRRALYTTDINEKTYYGLALALDRKDKRHRAFYKQREERGWDDTDTWSLASTIASFALPRLRRFKEIAMAHPAAMSAEDWDRELDEMIFAMEQVTRDDGAWDWDEATGARVQRGLELFGSKFLHLWW